MTVIIDLTPVRCGSGPARLLDMVQGRSKQAFKQCLAERGEVLARRARGRRDGRVHRVQDRHHPGTTRGRGRDGPLPRLAGDALDECRRRVQQDTRGHRGRKGDPLYADRRTLHTGAGLLTDKQQQRLGRCSPSTIMSRRAAGSTSA